MVPTKIHAVMGFDDEVRDTNYREDIQILGAPPCHGMVVLDLLDEALNSSSAGNVFCCEDENGLSRLNARAYPAALAGTNEHGASADSKGLRLSINPALLGFADGIFDAIVFSETLDARPNLADTPAECRCVLRTGGVLLATFHSACLEASDWETSRVLDWNVVAMCKAAGFANVDMIYISNGGSRHSW